LGGAERDRTVDLRLAKPALSQLSYSPRWFRPSASMPNPTITDAGVRTPTTT
jgi:hypothetical protein